MAGLTDKKVEQFMNALAGISAAIQEEYDALPIGEEVYHPKFSSVVNILQDTIEYLNNSIDLLDELLGVLKGGAA